MIHPPLILTARIDETDLAPFDSLRQRHFPPERNFLRAHLTIFHKLPGERLEPTCPMLAAATSQVKGPVDAAVTGIRHLGAGVAFALASPVLEDLRTHLCRQFMPWLEAQDRQVWHPHITIQNKVSKPDADLLHARLCGNFQPHDIRIIGLDLWRYLGGPWRFEKAFLFRQEEDAGKEVA